MPATRTQAYDQIMSLVTTALVSAGIDSKRIFYDDKSGKPLNDDEWARVLFRHTASNKTSLTGTAEKSRFTRAGLLTVQVFTKSGTGLERDHAVVPVVQAALEGKTTSGGVQFLAVSANEIGEDGPWFNTNITANVEYDEFVAA